jgi:nitrate reductase NapA
MDEDKVAVCLIMCTNPAQSLPNANLYREAMKKCFLVVADIFEDTETAQYADVILPAAFYTEKTGVYGQTERRYQLVEKLIDPPGEARSDLEIIVDLAERLGHGGLIKNKTAKDTWDEWRKVSAHSKYNFEGITYERLQKERGLQWPCPTEDHPGTVRRYCKGDPFVQEGREIQFYGKPDNKAVVFLRPYIPSTEKTTDQYPLYLTTGRVIEQWHTGTMTDKIYEISKTSGRGRFFINPQDAYEAKVTDGDEIELESRYGKITGMVEISEDESPGVLFASFFDSKFLVNVVVSDLLDPFSKQPEYKITAVSIKKHQTTS